MFPAAWFTLWALQAAALARVVQTDSRWRVPAVVMLITQFIVAVAWQAVVFGPGRLLLAAVWLTVVLALVVVTVAVCYAADRRAGLLVAPTIVWVSVATALGWSLYQLNPGA
jgi:translocator protein